MAIGSEYLMGIQVGFNGDWYFIVLSLVFDGYFVDISKVFHENVIVLILYLMGVCEGYEMVQYLSII